MIARVELTFTASAVLANHIFHVCELTHKIMKRSQPSTLESFWTKKKKASNEQNSKYKK